MFFGLFKKIQNKHAAGHTKSSKVNPAPRSKEGGFTGGGVKKSPKRAASLKKSKKGIKRVPGTPVKKKISETEIGKITHYFPMVKAGVVKVTKGLLKRGDIVHIKGHTTDFKQKVVSLQINNKPVLRAKKQKEAGLLVKYRVRINDKVYKLISG